MFCASDQRILSTLYRKARFRISKRTICLRLTSLALLLLCNAALFLPFALLRRLPPVLLRTFFYKVYLRVLGISLRVHGSPLRCSRVLYVSNHISYIDIAALMSLTGARFISRGDIARIPFFGWLMKSYGTVFIRRVRKEVREQVALLARFLNEGKPMLLFGEGTTSDGRGILPVKPSLFAALESTDLKDLAIQPLTLRYSLLDRLPMSTRWEPLCAWHGETWFLPHLWEALSLHRILIDIYIHPPTPAGHIEGERKGIARFCHERLQDGLERLRYSEHLDTFAFGKKCRAS